MVSRRFALALLFLFGFRLVAVGGALVCTAHGSHTHVAEAGHHGDAPQHDQNGKQTPCNTSDSADCCATMASCSVVLASATILASLATPPDYAGRLAQRNDAPLARADSPDPPPPKS